jgi:Domain of unknown function (DUF6431)
MVIVWACPLTVEDYAAAGRDVSVPRPNCPSCGQPVAFEGSYRRVVRDGVRRIVVRVPRARCSRCDVEHALLPDFLTWRRRYGAETVGATVASAALSLPGPAGVPASTARAWRRDFRGREAELATGMAAAAVVLGDLAPRLPVGLGPTAVAVAAVAAAWAAARRRRPGSTPSLWRFANVMVGGTLWSTRVELAWALKGLPVAPAHGP